MKKMKKVLAMLLALTMVLGMNLTSMAATKDEATITVNNVGNEATLSYVQVIEPDQTTVTGWDFTSDVIATAYISAFTTVDDEETTDVDESFTPSRQQAIAMLIKAATPDATLQSSVATVSPATASQIDKALSNVSNNTDVVYVTMSNTQTVTVAGVYAIKATESGYSYKNMAAYVGFGVVNGEENTYDYPSLMDEELEAKKSSLELTKEVTDDNHVTEIGDVLTYTITTKVPYIDANAENRTFKITDSLTGAEYFLAGTATVDGASVEAVAKVEMGTGNVVADVDDFVVEGNGFTIDLSSLIEDANGESNPNAGKDIIVTYTVKVNSVEIENTAANHVSGEKVDSDSEGVFTGKITLTKYAGDADNEDLDDNEKLSGAGYKVYKEVTVEGEKVTKWATFDTNYKLTGWGDDEGSATEVTTTGEDGKFTVSGLDVGTYWFKEVTAPKGYSVNETDVSATLALVDGATEATAELSATTHMIDTKLNALPSTGGIGTTIFTVAGCGIMIAAAYFFFASRKKENN